MICGEPLGRSSRFSLPAAKNAKELPSGDQNAESTSSVPGSAAAASESKDRNHSVSRHPVGLRRIATDRRWVRGRSNPRQTSQSSPAAKSET